MSDAELKALREELAALKREEADALNKEMLRGRERKREKEIEALKKEIAQRNNAKAKALNESAKKVTPVTAKPAASANQQMTAIQAQLDEQERQREVKAAEDQRKHALAMEQGRAELAALQQLVAKQDEEHARAMAAVERQYREDAERRRAERVALQQQEDAARERNRAERAQRGTGMYTVGDVVVIYPLGIATDRMGVPVNELNK